MLDYQIFIVSLQETNNRGHNYDLLTLVTSGSGWKPVLLVTVGKCDSICLRIKVMLLNAGWKPVPKRSTLNAHHSTLSDSDKPLAIAIAFAIAIV